METGVGSCPGVDLFLSNCPLAESPTTSQCQVECWQVIVEVESFYEEFLKRGGTMGIDWVASHPPPLGKYKRNYLGPQKCRNTYRQQCSLGDIFGAAL